MAKGSQETNKRLPTVLIPKLEEGTPQGGYLCTIDKEQRSKHTFKTEDGGTGTLYIPTEYIGDNRIKHPNIGTIVKCFGDAQFNVGDQILCNHFTFSDHDRTFKVLYTDEDGIEYYRVLNNQVYFKINEDGTLTNRKGLLLCEGIVDKVYETSLILPDSMIEPRRDVVKVLQVFEGCTEYRVGNYLLINKGADYPFEHEKKEYLKVDVTDDFDVLAIVPDDKIRKTETHRRANDHNKRSEPS